MDESLEEVEKLFKNQEISQEAYDNLKLWLSEGRFGDFRSEIQQLLDSNDLAALEDAFYKHIEIGTGGIRGQIGAGPNRINLQTIGEAAQGLSNFIEDFGSEAKEKGVVVGYEARRMSVEFAKLCASVFAANGIKTYLFDGLRSTPEISFAVRHLGATAGVQLTASHNPRTDNGFKFYWSDGGQVVPPADQKFKELVASVTEIKKVLFSEAKSEGFIKMIGEDIDKAYLKEVRNLSLVTSRSAKIVFSPIHGAGIKNVLPVLQEENFDVMMVPEQSKPDENFPTAVGDLINPEYREVMELPMSYGEKNDADVVITSDPDADRIGIAARIKLGESKLQFLTGNEVGVIMGHFILSRLKEKGELKNSNLVLETYVTSTLISDIAKSFGVTVKDDLLVGFKFIGEIIEKLDNKSDFIFAAEESLGYLRGTFTRDKDAAIGALTIAEAASFLKDNGQTLIEYLDDIYKEFGYYKNILNMAEMKGKVGFINTGRIMMGLRTNPPETLAGIPVVRINDRLPAEKSAPDNYKTGTIGDQLTFVLSQDERVKVTVRPSGTEPKIKYYIQNFAKVAGDLTQIKEKIDTQAKKLEEAILTEAQKYVKDTA